MTERFLRFIPLLHVLFGILNLAGQTSTASVQGRIVSEAGTPISNASVSYHRVRTLVKIGNSIQAVPGESSPAGSVLSGSDGGFRISALPAGQYLFCVETTDAAYLDPCRWSGTLSLNLLAGQTSALNVALRIGVFLKIHLNDPANLLPTLGINPHFTSGVRVGVIVGAGGFWAAAPANAQSLTDFVMSIPVNVPLRLWASAPPSTGITDADGNAVPNSGAVTPFEAAAGVGESITLNLNRAQQ